jgi:hypothetical protein
VRAARTAWVVGLLAGCAALHTLDTDVSAWSRWPAERRPATYAFERLPSQQDQPQAQLLLENAATPALAAAGFSAAPAGADADVTVQLGARITPTDRSPYDDPYWWGPWWPRPYLVPRTGVVYAPGWHYPWGWPPMDTYGYEREVAVLIRDRRTGEALYEARVTSDGYTPMVETALPAMFRAALHDFPNPPAQNPHRVSVDLRGASS